MQIYRLAKPRAPARNKCCFVHLSESQNIKRTVWLLAILFHGFMAVLVSDRLPFGIPWLHGRPFLWSEFPSFQSVLNQPAQGLFIQALRRGFLVGQSDCSILTHKHIPFLKHFAVSAVHVHVASLYQYCLLSLPILRPIQSTSILVHIALWYVSHFDLSEATDLIMSLKPIQNQGPSKEFIIQPVHSHRV